MKRGPKSAAERWKFPTTRNFDRGAPDDPPGVTADSPAPPEPAAVRCRGVSVSFGAVRALREVDLELAPGRIHALVGQNGAGKTTLARVLAGLQAPDAGRVWVAGRELAGGGVRAAQAAGLAMVHQHFSLPPSFTVAEALELTAARPGGKAVYRRAGLEKRWRRQVEGLEAVSLSVRIRDLPVEARQSLEIVRALASQARVLLLDEPTALLTPAAAENLFERLRRLREEGVTALVVLHKLREVAAAADTVSVLRDGKLVLGPLETSAADQGRLSDAIVGGSGRAEAGEAAIERAEGASGGAAIRLELAGASTKGSAHEVGLRRVDMRVGAGEIVGVAGVEGNGQRNLVSAIAGLTRLEKGEIRLGGRSVNDHDPARRRRRGLRLVPFDRHTEGVSSTAPLWLNQSALRLAAGERRRPLVSVRRMREEAKSAMDKWRVRYQTVAQPAGSLSGGNIQRLILSRELAGGAEMLIAAQPTRGLDFAATEFVRASLSGMRDIGAGVLLVSSDLDELFELSDRLLVMLGGRVAAEFAPPYDRRAVGDAMIGAER